MRRNSDSARSCTPVIAKRSLRGQPHGHPSAEHRKNGRASGDTTSMTSTTPWGGNATGKNTSETPLRHTAGKAPPFPPTIQKGEDSSEEWVEESASASDSSDSGSPDLLRGNHVQRKAVRNFVRAVFSSVWGETVVLHRATVRGGGRPFHQCLDPTQGETLNQPRQFPFRAADL